jgi:hypothetical protein
MAAGWHLPLIGGKLGLGMNDAEPFLLSSRVPAMIRFHGSHWWRFDLAGKENKDCLGHLK